MSRLAIKSLTPVGQYEKLVILPHFTDVAPSGIITGGYNYSMMLKYGFKFVFSGQGFLAVILAVNKSFHNDHIAFSCEWSLGIPAVYHSILKNHVNNVCRPRRSYEDIRVVIGRTDLLV